VAKAPSQTPRTQIASKGQKNESPFLRSAKRAVLKLLDVSPLDVLRVILRRPRWDCGDHAVADPTFSGVEQRKKLLDIGAKFLADGDIEVQGVRFRPSYPTFKRVLVENLYFENYNFSLHGSWTIFDIGATAGATTLWLARLANVKKVYAFEPVAPTYQMLLDNLKANPPLKDKIKAFPIGLGARKKRCKSLFTSIMSCQ
jgi:hypothetical protein